MRRSASRRARFSRIAGAAALCAGCGLYDHSLIEGAPRANTAGEPGRSDEARARKRTNSYTAAGQATPVATNAGAGGAAEDGESPDSEAAASGAGGSAGTGGTKSEPMRSESSAQDAGDASEPAAPELRESAACGDRPGYVSPDRHCYIPIAEPVTWYMARDLCRQRRSHLATITSREEQAFLARIEWPQATWIGLSRFGAPSYSWVTEESLGFTAWQPGAPSERRESAGLLAQDSAAWLDAPPSELHAALCERDNDR